MHDALVISDIHLGSENCQAKALVHFLEEIHCGDVQTERLILNGDVFDSIDFRRLKKQHWKVLSLLRKLSNDMEIVWVNGNHDGPADTVSHLLGVGVQEEYVIDSGNRRILFLHGHRFDEFLERYPITTKLADGLYRLLQWLDKSHTIARTAKQSSKTFLRCARKVEEMAVAYARKQGCHAVCCGHTHLPVAVRNGDVEYYNSGCWTERPCHYLVIDDGQIELKSYGERILEHIEEPMEFALPAAR